LIVCKKHTVRLQKDQLFISTTKINIYFLFRLRFACKFVEKPGPYSEEVPILKKLNNHDHILRFVEDFEIQYFSFIITEFCNVKQKFPFYKNLFL
jgi:hypothetical protein